MWIDGSNSWDLHLCCNLNDLEIFGWATLSHLLSLVRIRPTSNTWIWPINPSLTFTVKFLMANLVGSVESPRKDLYSIVWKDHYPKKIKIFLWGLIALVLSIRLIGYKGGCLTCISSLLGPPCITNMPNIHLTYLLLAHFQFTSGMLFWNLLVGL